VLIIFGSGIVLPFLLFLLYFNLLKYSLDNKLPETILVDILPRAIRIFFQFSLLPTLKDFLVLRFKRARLLINNISLNYKINEFYAKYFK